MGPTFPRRHVPMIFLRMDSRPTPVADGFYQYHQIRREGLRPVGRLQGSKYPGARPLVPRPILWRRPPTTHFPHHPRQVIRRSTGQGRRADPAAPARFRLLRRDRKAETAARHLIRSTIAPRYRARWRHGSWRVCGGGQGKGFQMGCP